MIWVREMSSRSLHGLAGRLDIQFRERGTSASQDWLWEQIIRELEFRRRRAKSVWDTCSCLLCVPPFDTRRGMHDPLDVD